MLIWEVDWLALDVLLAGEADFEEEVLEVFGSATAFAGEGVALTEVVEDAAKLCRRLLRPAIVSGVQNNTHCGPGLALFAGAVAARAGAAVDQVPALVAKPGVVTRAFEEASFSVGVCGFGDANGEDEPDERSGEFHREGVCSSREREKKSDGSRAEGGGGRGGG